MVEYEQATPYVLLFSTLVLELFAFMTSHMVDSRNFSTLHEGLFKRCIYPIRDGGGGMVGPTTESENAFTCLWWSADTFNADRGILLPARPVSHDLFYLYALTHKIKLRRFHMSALKLVD